MPSRVRHAQRWRWSEGWKELAREGVYRAGGAPRGSDLGPHLLNEFLPQRGSAYQPRATPWESCHADFRIVTGRRKSSHCPPVPERSASTRSRPDPPALQAEEGCGLMSAILSLPHLGLHHASFACRSSLFAPQHARAHRLWRGYRLYDRSAGRWVRFRERERSGGHLLARRRAGGEVPGAATREPCCGLPERPGL